MGQRMMVVVLSERNSTTKTYRAAREEDMDSFQRAQKALHELLSTAPEERRFCQTSQ
jgi:hypothetical protein